MEFGGILEGSPISLVCKMKIFDITHERHIMVADHTEVTFGFSGLLDFGHDSYTLLDAEFVKQFPVPLVKATHETKVMYHDLPSWHILHELIDVCSGFGGMSQGAHAGGFFVKVAVDHNSRMLSLFQKQFNCDVVVGDVGCHDVMFNTWHAARGASCMSAGFACQPYSRLGDCRGREDERASCLTKVLNMAYFMRVHVLVLECVSPAAQNDFVKEEIAHFTNITGFHGAQCELRLDMAWPTRRSRAWWVLTSPLVGSVDLHSWPTFDDVTHVSQVIPFICPWDPRDELALTLNHEEASAFGLNDGSFTRFLLDAKGIAPCALHSWGNQLLPCPCGCRNQGLSKFRLETKGLFGLLVRSAPNSEGVTSIRHVHPSECLALNAMDPVIDYGLEVRLTLCAIGQLASPLQALWVFSSVASQLDLKQFGQALFSPLAQIQAFRAWLLMRCRQVWQAENEPVENRNTASLISFWQEFSDLSLPELMYLPQWDEISECSISLAAILDAIIRMKQLSSRPPSVHFQEVPAVGERLETPPFDEPETPWFAPPSCSEAMQVDCPPDVCQAFFPDCDQAPVQCLVSQESTIDALLAAQVKLVGDLGPVVVAAETGKVLSHEHGLSQGSTVFVRQCKPVHSCPEDADSMDVCVKGLSQNAVTSDHRGESGPLPKLPVPSPLVAEHPGECRPLPIMPVEFQNHDCRMSLEGNQVGVSNPPSTLHAHVGRHDLDNPGHEVISTALDPTATWSQPIVDPAQAQIDHVALHDSGPKCVNAADEVVATQPYGKTDFAQSWISAAPLLALQTDQFVQLSPPCINCHEHLDALRNQFVLPCDRREILNKQGDAWADDEIRFHLRQFQQKMSASDSLKPGTSVPLFIDPLLCASWQRNQGFTCKQWCRHHPEVFAAGVQVIACFRVEAHWVPVWLVPMKNHLNIVTWDAACNSHADLDKLLENMSLALGFSSFLINRQQRLFFSTHLCGALSIAFLHHALFDTMLPTSHAEAAILQARMKQAFATAVSTRQTVTRPWIWGNGDSESDERDAVAALSEDQPQTCPEHVQSASQFQEIDLARYEAEFPHATFGFGRQGSFAHRCMSAEERIQLMVSKGKAMADDEIRFHVIDMLQSADASASADDPHAPGFAFLDPLIFSTWDTVGRDLCVRWCHDHPQIKAARHKIVSAINFDEHWIPLWVTSRGETLQLHMVDNFHGMFPGLKDFGQTLRSHLGFEEVAFHWLPIGLPQHELCGALTLSFLGHIIAQEDLPQTLQELADVHANLRAAFVEAVYRSTCCRCPTVWGLGPGPLCRELAAELMKHGVPESEADNRAAQAIRAIGSDQIQQALQAKQPWRQLKTLANHVRFQFLLPTELAEVVASNRGKQVGKKPKSATGGRVSKMPQAVELDPQKIKFLEGCFRADQQVVPQILPQQIGPVASGVVLMSPSEAEPYLRAGTQVPQEPLALAICMSPDVTIDTALPHKAVTIPCRCLVDNEPILVEAVLVQLSRGFVDKVAGQAKVELESLDVVTVKMISFKDELPIEWDVFAAAPIKHLVSQFPLLRRCDVTGCQCPHWHNQQALPVRDPILDVWRRQFLRVGFKPVPASKADFFTVCIRIPKILMQPLLEASGKHGTYCEPRSADGKDILPEFSVIWTPRQSVSELQHLKQTNPAVVGLARMGDRRGLRVLASQAQSVHGVLRPDAMFLPQGPRCEFLAGPFPYGTDRHAICKALKQAG